VRQVLEIGHLRHVPHYALPGFSLQLLNSYAAAKKVSAAPHRGEPNRPIKSKERPTPQGKPPNPRRRRQDAESKKNRNPLPGKTAISQAEQPQYM
jgi:hypothetical protein